MVKIGAQRLTQDTTAPIIVGCERVFIYGVCWRKVQQKGRVKGEVFVVL